MAVLSLLTALLLSSPAIAAPTVYGRNSLETRGFRTSARHYRPKHTITKRQEGGVVQATTNGGGWLVVVQIGGQDVTLNVDTGSSDLWTASTLMPEDQQDTVTTGQIYDPGLSPTYRPLNDSTFDIGYADGSGASGPAALDTVNVGTASVPNMAFGVCEDLRYGEGSSGDRDTDGPLGLGFGYGNSIRPVQQSTFMEALVPYVSEPVFGSAFRLDDSGFIDFGYSDSAAYTGELTNVPIANTSEGNEGAWVTQGVQFGSGGNLFSPAPMDLAFDSGTASLSLPADAASEYFALIEGSSDESGSWTYPCGSGLPDFEFTFTQITSGPSTVTIPGDSLKNGDAPEGDCGTWIDVVDGRGNAGLPFYINKYMIWNQAVPSLSFADQA